MRMFKGLWDDTPNTIECLICVPNAFVLRTCLMATVTSIHPFNQSIFIQLKRNCSQVISISQVWCTKFGSFAQNGRRRATLVERTHQKCSSNSLFIGNGTNNAGSCVLFVENQRSFVSVGGHSRVCAPTHQQYGFDRQFHSFAQTLRVLL